MLHIHLIRVRADPRLVYPHRIDTVCHNIVMVSSELPFWEPMSDRAKSARVSGVNEKQRQKLCEIEPNKYPRKTYNGLQTNAYSRFSRKSIYYMTFKIYWYKMVKISQQRIFGFVTS